MSAGVTICWSGDRASCMPGTVCGTASSSSNNNSGRTAFFSAEGRRNEKPDDPRDDLLKNRSNFTAQL